MQHSLKVSRRLLEEPFILDELMAEVRALRKAVRSVEAMPKPVVVKPVAVTPVGVRPGRSSAARTRPNDRAA